MKVEWSRKAATVGGVLTIMMLVFVAFHANTFTGYVPYGNLMLVIAIVSLTDYIKKAFRLDGVTHCLLLLISVAMFLVQKWLTRSGLISSNTLISEGISIPFYLLFFRVLFCRREGLYIEGEAKSEEHRCGA